ncbi:MAG: hypothetical protein QOK34_2213 [Gaiellaceae bacterium]|jgi:hypothetical protein|nr:hypothetical protein [Gaiellaceae bacterium]
MVSSRGFLIRFLLGLLGSLAAVALVVGFVFSSRPAEGHVLAAGVRGGSWATPAELAWLGKLGAWDTRLLRGLQSAARVETTPQLAQKLLNRDGHTMVIHQRALRPASSCAADLERNVGHAPSARLQRAFDTFGQACMHLERFHTAITLAINGQQSSQMAHAQQDAKRAAAILLEADQMLPPGEVRSLPVIAGATTESRVEPRFGRIASALAGKQVEVRCWSGGDWQHLMREEGAYTQGRLRADTLGFAGIGADRINLAPSVCDGLVQLAYEHARPTDAAGRLALAAAVVTLTHEPRHSSGIADEAVVECQAIQLANRTAVKLGATPAYAASLVREYWSHYSEELPAYRSTECRPGGKLDLGNASSVW